MTDMLNVPELPFPVTPSHPDLLKRDEHGAVVAAAPAVVAAELPLSSPQAAASRPNDNSTDPIATPLEALRRAGRLRNVPPIVGVSRCTR